MPRRMTRSDHDPAVGCKRYRCRTARQIVELRQRTTGGDIEYRHISKKAREYGDLCSVRTPRKGICVGFFPGNREFQLV